MKEGGEEDSVTLVVYSFSVGWCYKVFLIGIYSL